MELAKLAPDSVIHLKEASVEIVTALPEVTPESLLLSEEHLRVTAAQSPETTVPEVVVRVAKQVPEELLVTDMLAEAERREPVAVTATSLPETKEIPIKNVSEVEHESSGEDHPGERPSVTEVISDEGEPSLPVSLEKPVAEITVPDGLEVVHVENEPDTEETETYEATGEMRYIAFQEDEITAEKAELSPAETFEAIITGLLTVIEQKGELPDLPFLATEEQGRVEYLESTVQLLQNIQESMAELTPEAVESVVPTLHEMVEIIWYVQTAVAEEADETTMEAAILRLTEVCEAFLDTLNIGYEEADIRNLVTMLLTVNLPTEEPTESFSNLPVDSGTHERKHPKFQLAVMSTANLHFHRTLGMKVLSLFAAA